MSKFKLGDWVVIDYVSSGHSGKVGHCGKITAIAFNGYCTLTPHCTGGSWTPEELRLATVEEIKAVLRKHPEITDTKYFDIFKTIKLNLI